MRDAVIVDAVRTPIGKRGGMLKEWHPVDLASEVLSALVRRAAIDPGVVDDVMLGCGIQTGEQGVNIGRNAALAAGFPDSVPGMTIDRQCGSSQQAIHSAAHAIMAGACEVVIAGGVESMTRVPMGSTADRGPGLPFGPRMRERYDGALVSQGISAELIAKKWGLDQRELDELALASHMRAHRAVIEGHFRNELIPIETSSADPGEPHDEGIRSDTSMDVLSSLKPVFSEEGVITAGNSSQISDGAAGLLIMSQSKAESLGLRARARFCAFDVVGVDPIMMLTGPILATDRILNKAGLELADIDLFEINEAFASVTAAWLRETNADHDRLNVNGGAIALGHPIGASGARLMATLLNELERRGGRFGLQSMCEGGGMANATIIERLG